MQLREQELSKLSDDQKQAYDLIMQGENVFLTGKAGSGKSHIIRLIKDEHTVVCAPSGIAALNAGGMTIHRMFGLHTGKIQPKDFYTVGSYMRKLFKVGSPVKRLVIDEVGMCLPITLDLIDSKLRTLRKSEKPFGDIQIIAVGDGFQLESILDNLNKEDFYKSYKNKWFFSAKCWNFKNILLSTPHRQLDQQDLRILNAIRVKSDNVGKALQALIAKSNKNPPKDGSVMTICNYKADAAAINAQYYSKIQSEPKKYKAHVTGTDKNWKELFVEEEMEYKIGVRVLVVANDPEGQYVNGSFGKVTRLLSWGVEVILDSKPDTPILIKPFTWKKTQYDEKDGELIELGDDTFTQIPLVLGYAATTHKLQGTTLNKAIIDLGKKSFSHGQTYVAISRVKELKNISFARNPTINDIIVDPLVVNWYDSLALIN